MSNYAENRGLIDTLIKLQKDQGGFYERLKDRNGKSENVQRRRGKTFESRGVYQPYKERNNTNGHRHSVQGSLKS